MNKARKVGLALWMILSMVTPHVGWAQGADDAANSTAAPAQASSVVGDTTKQITKAVVTSGEAVQREGANLWTQVLVPMFQRFAGAFPVILKALLLLVAFWFIGTLLGAGVAKLLGLTRLDERAAHDWGLEKLLVSANGEKRSLERIIGGTIKWLIILFGLVAFFQALNLPMVAGPLQNIADRVVSVVPNLLQAAVILFGYWIVAVLVRLAITRGLSALKFDDRFGKYLGGGRSDSAAPSATAGRLVFYVILLFGLPPFLQALGQEALVKPLQDMLARALSILPNIVAALIILLIGNVVATIVREVASNALAAVGLDRGAEKLGIGQLTGSKRLSEIIGLIAYFFIIVPMIVSAVDTVGITAISDPVKSTLSKILDVLPDILAAALVIFAGYAIARIVRRIVESFLSGIGADQFPAKVGFSAFPADGRYRLSSVLAAIAAFVILLLTAQQALDIVGFKQLAGLADQLVRYLPKVAIAFVILLAAFGIGAYVGRLATQAAAASQHAALAGTVARYAVIFLGISMALDELGVSREIVVTAVTAVLGGVALAIGLAFGLGGKDKAKEIIEHNMIYRG